MKIKVEYKNILTKNIIITGLPGVGKTTLIKKLSEKLKEVNPVGFYTEEIRENSIRKGFRLVSFDGREEILSHVNIKSTYRVGKYRVDIRGFEEFLKSIPFLDRGRSLVFIDEIGRMECFSKQFINLLYEILDSGKILVATAALKGSGLISDIKKRADIKLFEITHRNRDSAGEEIVREVRKILHPGFISSQ